MTGTALCSLGDRYQLYNPASNIIVPFADEANTVGQKTDGNPALKGVRPVWTKQDQNDSFVQLLVILEKSNDGLPSIWHSLNNNKYAEHRQPGNPQRGAILFLDTSNAAQLGEDSTAALYGRDVTSPTERRPQHQTHAHSHTVMGTKVERLGWRNLVIADKLHMCEGEDSSAPIYLPFPLPIDVGGQHFDDLPFLKQSHNLLAVLRRLLSRRARINRFLSSKINSLSFLILKDPTDDTF